MINNVEIIRPLLEFPTPGDSFYFVQIIKRRKENEDMTGDNQVIDNFYIDSLERFERKLLTMIKHCETFNARAYIRLNRRSYERVAMESIKMSFDCVMNKQFSAVRSAYDSACGNVIASDVRKTWIIDLDDEQALPDFRNAVLRKITSLRPDAFITAVPTKNGIHLITYGFNSAEFGKEFPQVDIHKDNPTILYIP